jgi:hypothetical protein
MNAKCGKIADDAEFSTCQKGVIDEHRATHEKYRQLIMETRRALMKD